MGAATAQCDCVAGTYTGSVGQSACDNCNSGYYQTGTGASSCVQVTGGYRAVDASNQDSNSGAVNQAICPESYYSLPGATTCTACDPDKDALSGATICYAPTGLPTSQPSSLPSGQPTGRPSGQPTGRPTRQPSGQPTSEPSGQPCVPTAAPSFVKDDDYQEVWDKKRSRRKGKICPKNSDGTCSGHGYCSNNNKCSCFSGINGEPVWTGADCSLRACPTATAWVSQHIVGANDMHHTAECSNKGLCDRTTGICTCFPGYDGLACQRSRCPDDCNGRGSCFPERILAIKANREYSTPWDANKHTGCFCDAGYRGASCELQECPTTADVIGGFGNEAGRDCSGRGICNYETGVCDCFTGFYGEGCDKQSLAAA